MPDTLQFDPAFLDVVPEPIATVPLVNVYDIPSDGWRESRVDMTLEFFLDPTELHGLGSLVMDALLRLLDGAPLAIGAVIHAALISRRDGARLVA